jgi:hypothetical protein
VCRVADASKCLPTVTCSGASSVCRVETEIQSITTLASNALSFSSFASSVPGIVYYSTLSNVRLAIASGAVGVPAGCPAVATNRHEIGMLAVATGQPCEDSNVQYVTSWVPMTSVTGNVPLPSTAVPTSSEYCVYLRLTGYQNVLEYSSSSLHVKLATFPSA